MENATLSLRLIAFNFLFTDKITFSSHRRNANAKIPGPVRRAVPPPARPPGEETLAAVPRHGSTLLGPAAPQMYTFAC